MAEKKIVAKIVLEGEKEYRASVASCNKSLSTMRSEMRLVEAECSGSANTLEALNKKHNVLIKTLEKAYEKEEKIQVGLQHARESYDKVGNELEDYRKQLAEAKEEQERLRAAGKESSEEMAYQTQRITELENAIKEGEGTYRRAGDRVSEWEKQLNNAKTQTINTTRALGENNALMDEAKQSADGCAKSIDAYGNSVNQAAQETEKLALETKKIYGREKEIEVLENLGEALKTVAAASYEAARELDEGYDTIITKTGATGEALSGLTDTANNIFGNMPVEMADVGTAIGEINTRFGTTGEVLEKTSELFLQFAEINGTDLNSSIDTTDRILTQFNVSAEHSGEVLGILTKRGQETGKSVSDLMSELDGNAATFKELDLNLAESVNLLALLESNGVDSSTAIRGLKTAVNNYAQEGLGARDALELTIDSIKNATSETEALRIAQETFGTRGAQVMADGIRDGRISLDDLNESLDKYGNTVKTTFNETLDPWDKATIAANNLKIAGSELVGEFLETAMPAIEKTTDAVRSLTDGFKKWPEPIKKTAASLGGLAVGAAAVVPKVWKLHQSIQAIVIGRKAASALETLSAAQKVTSTVTTVATTAQAANTVATAAQTTATTAQTAATVAATTAQQGLNIAMLANPATLVIGGIVALTAAVAVFSSGQDEAKDKTNELAEAAEQAGKKLNDAADNLQEASTELETAMTMSPASGDVANQLASDLEDLAGKTTRTAEEQTRMQVIVGKLNTMFPEMGLEIGKVNGELNMGSDEIRKYINSAVEMGKIQAIRDKVSDATKKLVDAEIELSEGEAKLKETQEAIREIQDARAKADQAVVDKQKELRDAQIAYSEALETGKGNLDELYLKTQDHSEAQIEYQGVLMTVTEAYERMAEDEEILRETQRGLTDTISETQAEVESANNAVVQATEYLNANTEATNANTEASAQKQEASTASIEVLGQETEAYNQLSEKQKELAVDVTNSVLTMQENVQGALESQMNMFEEFNAGTEISKEKLLTNMQSQIEGVQNWEQNLTELAQKGINEGLLQKLAEMGPQGSTYVDAFNQMTTDELTKAGELWDQSIDIKSMTDEWGTELLESGATSIAGGMEGLKGVLESSGADTVQGLVKGMQNAQSVAEQTGKDIGVKTVDSINSGAGVNSPSWKTRNTGMYLGDGLRDGLDNSGNNVRSAGSRLGEDAVSAVAETASPTRLYGTGYNLAVGFADGIYAGESRVINAAISMASDAIIAANNTLEINSPSRVFRRIGGSVVEGYVKGMTDGKNQVKNTVNSLLNTSDISTELPVGRIQYAIDAGMSMRASEQQSNPMPELAEMLHVLQMYLPYLATARDVYLDKNKVVGEILPEINRQLPITAAREARR